MAKPTLNIRIPEPCSENFRKMPVQGEGRFCAVCNKCVIDFTAKTDREIMAFFKNKPASTCGFFRPDQLNRNIYLPEQTPATWWKTLALSAFAAFSSFSAQAASTLTTLAAYSYPKANPSNTKGKFLTISGVVKDGQGMPLPEAFISYKGKTGFVAYTNPDGRFSFKVPVTDFKTGSLQLKVSRVGYFCHPIILRQPKSYNLMVQLKADSAQAGPELPTVVIRHEAFLAIGGEYMPTFGNDKISQETNSAQKPKFFPRTWKQVKAGFNRRKD